MGLRVKCTVPLLLAATVGHAQGITNPAGGGVIPVYFLLVLGLALAAWLVARLTALDDDGRTSPPAVLISCIAVFSLASITTIYAAEHFSGALYLYLEVLLLLIGAVFLLFRSTSGRSLGVATIVVAVIILNLLQPKLVDLQDRRYVNNERDYESVQVRYPGHWREMHLDDGRVLLNINRHRQVGGSMRMQAEANAIDSPVLIDLRRENSHPVIKTLFRQVRNVPKQYRRNRNQAFFRLPVFGTVTVPRIEVEPAGTALLLDENGNVACDYLLAARSEPIPERVLGTVVWSRESTIEDRSVVRCEE